MFTFINKRFFNHHYFSICQWQNYCLPVRTTTTTATDIIINSNRLNNRNSLKFIQNSKRYLSSQSQKNSRNNNEIDVTDVSALKSNDDNETDKKIKFRGKTPELPKVYLRDEKNRLLGLMTLIEAEKLAQKHKKILIKTESPAKKFMSMKFADPRFVADQNQNDKILDGDDTDHTDKEEEFIKRKTSPKILSFTTKMSEHDLQIKINQVKRFLLRGQETLVKVVSTVSDGSYRTKLEQILNEFESIFNETNGCRINQKRLTDRDLKFNILISNINKAKKNLSTITTSSETTTTTNEKNDTIPNLDNVDPNKLLEQDVESILDNNDNKKK